LSSNGQEKENRARASIIVWFFPLPKGNSLIWNLKHIHEESMSVYEDSLLYVDVMGALCEDSFKFEDRPRQQGNDGVPSDHGSPSTLKESKARDSP